MTDPLARLRSLPRVSLAHLPTPLEEMPRLAKTLGIAHLWVKRDDCTGLGFGGNKVRKLEFDLAAALDMKADCVVCGSITRSDVARQVAAASANLNIECHRGIMRGRRLRVFADNASFSHRAARRRVFGSMAWRNR